MPGPLTRKRGRVPNRMLAPGLVEQVSFTIGVESSNIINVGMQFKGSKRKDLGVRGSVGFYLSDDANGDSTIATAPDGGIAIGTDGVMQEFIADKAGRLISEVDGDVDINITHAAGAKTLYLVIILADGSLVVSNAITFA